jgi:nitroimidazol reductase NimA-like FMN-containing flavoprotein (pyridoxamine 5'-phosphate oxidase superfamily)
MNLTKRTELRRLPSRGSRDLDTINAILDAGFLAHVGFCVDGQPYVIPTLYGRDGEGLYLHGSAASRMLGRLETGIPGCVTVTLVDGLVLARSAFNHSMNYRSVVAFGTAHKVDEPTEKTRALRIISEHLIAGRWNDIRTPSENELKATAVLKFSIEEASAKIRTGPPLDDEQDYRRPYLILDWQRVPGCQNTSCELGIMDRRSTDNESAPAPHLAALILVCVEIGCR